MAEKYSVLELWKILGENELRQRVEQETVEVYAVNHTTQRWERVPRQCWRHYVYDPLSNSLVTTGQPEISTVKLPQMPHKWYALEARCTEQPRNFMRAWQWLQQQAERDPLPMKDECIDHMRNEYKLSRADAGRVWDKLPKDHPMRRPGRREGSGNAPERR